MKFSIIAAADKKLGIGINNQMPWHLEGDLKYFSEVTSKALPGKMNAVIMGRKTWESLPEKHRPLKGRLNVVLSRGGIELVEGKTNKELSELSGDIDVPLLCSSLDEALATLEKNPLIDKVFVIGGATVFQEAIHHPQCEKIYLTEVMAEFQCDAFFPKIPAYFVKKNSSEVVEEKVPYRFIVYDRG